MPDARASFQQALHLISFDPVVSRLAASVGESDLARIASAIARADPYHEREPMRAALAMIAVHAASDVTAALEHQLWCAWREARWQSGEAMRELSLRVTNRHFLDETCGHPTIVIAPMTLRLADAASAMRRVFGRRPVVYYGEDVDPGTLSAGFDGAIVAGDGLAAVRRISAVLRAGGVLCSYADFAYRGHAARTMSLFGRQRPVASGMLSLAVRFGAMLLPMVALRVGEGIEVRVQEPLRLDDGGTRLHGGDKLLAMEAVAEAIGEALEASIRCAPHQWLLLTTLTFDAPQMASTGGVSG